MAINKTFDVVVAGAGPVGLLTACELALRNVSVLVLEKNDFEEYDPWIDGPLALRGLNNPSAELFYRRDMLKDLFPQPNRLTEFKQAIFAGHFAGIVLDGKLVDSSKWKHILPGPALFGGPSNLGAVRKILTARALKFGVQINHKEAVTNIKQSSSDIQITTSSDTYSAKFLVAADGGHSTIRHFLSSPFPGSEPSWVGYAAHCTLKSNHNLQMGFHRTPNGMYIMGPPLKAAERVEAGSVVLYAFDFDLSFDRKQAVSLNHFQKVARKVTGDEELVVEKIFTVGSFTDRARQVVNYRVSGGDGQPNTNGHHVHGTTKVVDTVHPAKSDPEKGRVFYAGDAAHVHAPLGGQGLNLGLSDAFNLGWKIAAVVNGEAHDELLDTYHAERWEVGQQVLAHTRAQTACITPGLCGEAMWNLVKDFSQTTDGATLLAGRFSMYERRVNLGGGHWLAGRSCPDFDFEDGTRLGPNLKDGKWLVLDFEGGSEVKELALTRQHTLNYCGGVNAKEKLGVKALLIRPDGVVAWASEEKNDTDGLKGALAQWLKPPAK